jgi:hypothetical protein
MSHHLKFPIFSRIQLRLFVIYVAFDLFTHRDFPGIRIGPEPTTDRFIAVMYDDKEGVVPGNY